MSKEGGLASIYKLSVGIVSQSLNMQSQGSVQGGDGMGGPGAQGSSHPGGNSQAMSTAIDIWFKVDLYRPI